MKQMIFAAALLSLAACAPASQDKTATTSSSSTTANETMGTNPAASAPTTTTAEEEKPMSYYEDKVAELHTTAGEIDIRFFPDVAPNHVRNFIDLAEKGFYNGIKFHRVIPGFMIQAGDPNTVSGDPSTWGSGGSPNKLKAEFSSIHHARGIVSAARLPNDINSASSQFFIMVGDAGSLDGQYSVFGRVTKGMDVADKIVSAPTRGDRPVNPTTITSVTIRPAKENEKGPAPK